VPLTGCGNAAGSSFPAPFHDKELQGSKEVKPTPITSLQGEIIAQHGQLWKQAADV